MGLESNINFLIEDSANRVEANWLMLLDIFIL